MQNRKKRSSDSTKKDESSGLQTGLLALGAAALGAVAGAAIYHGVRYFFDDSASNVTSDVATPIVESKSCAEVSQHYKESDARDTNSSVSICQRDDSASLLSSKNTDAAKPVDSLQSKLLAYSLSYISVAEGDVSSARKVVNKICSFVEVELRKQMAMFHWGQVNEAYFMSDLFLVRYPTEFYVTLPCSLPSSCWSLARCLSGNYQIVIEQNEQGLLQLPHYHQFLQDSNLSSQKVINAIFAALKAASRELGYNVSCKPSQSMVQISVKQSLNCTPVKMNVCLSMQVNGVEDIVLAADEGDEWQPECWRAVENKLEALGGNESCGPAVVRLMRAIQLNHPQYLADIDTMAWCSLLFHVADYEDEWAMHHLPERFLDMLKSFEQHLQQRNLPNYFNPRRNLLASLRKESITQFSQYLAEVIGTGAVERLLLNNY